ncbi:MAG: choice-of-anchor D domain-containing protein [Deltaproteobacteria bacterium]|nr:choice-of-anchor D domain-containing protein [Deltaproteobacteria bacterium]
MTVVRGLSFRSLALVSGAVALFAFGCGDTEFISVEKDPEPLRPIGESCTVDAECDTGRCVGGACNDNGCSNDEDCRSDEICISFGGVGACEPADDFACQTDQRPILSISQTSITFDQVSLGTSSTQIVTIENVGDCLLTLQVISFSENTNVDFACSPCSAEFFPQRIPPRRSLDVEVTYAPTRPGEANGDLLVRSDDATAGTAGLVSVDLFARYDGIPSLVVDPLSLSFGFVPFTAGGGGGSRTETITITNQGTGAAALEIERLFMDREDVFFITEVRQGDGILSLDAIDPETPLLIPPFTVDNPLAVVEVDVTFTPDDNRDFDDAVVVRPGGLSDTQRVTVELSGSSLGPPQIEVTVAEMIFGGPGQEAMPIGAVDFKQVTIRNNGQSELTINPAIGGGNASFDFSVMPPFVPPIAAGGAIILSVFYNPSEPSDPANTFSPTRNVEAALNITSNDTDPGTDVLKTVALKGFARSGVQDQILKVEMEFENADNSWAGSDFRNVDVVLASVDGAVTCTKPQPQIVGQAGSGFDFCADWDAAASYGQASWLSLGAFEEPERVVIRGLGPTGANGEEFEVEVVYIEDCANIPSGLLSDILGIGASVLLGVLGGAIGVPVVVPPSDISDTIANNCFDHASSQVVTRISLDGAVVASPSVRLNDKGDRAVMARLRRVNGAYCSLTPGVGNVDLQCQ